MDQLSAPFPFIVRKGSSRLSHGRIWEFGAVLEHVCNILVPKVVHLEVMLEVSWGVLAVKPENKRGDPFFGTILGLVLGGRGQLLGLLWPL